MEEYIDEDLDTTDIKVMDIMITHVIWVNPNTELKKVVQLMEMHQIGCLPVVEGKTLLGIITKNDLIELSHD
jgi:acetoin utilization protein AcuB